MRGRSCTLLFVWLLVEFAVGAAEVHDFFAKDAVVSIQLRIDDVSQQSLAKTPRENVQGSISLPGGTERAVKVHLIGNGSFQPIQRNPSFTIRLIGDPWLGQKRILLKNSGQDRSFLRWKLACEVFRRAGVPVARVNYAKVRLNERDLGLYLVVEACDKVFLKRHFSSAKGNLYEGGNNDVGDPLDQDNGSTSNRQDLQKLADACAIADQQKRWQALRNVLNISEFCNFMAAEVVVGHRDGYSMDRNNFRLYHDPASDKFVFIPHGMDLTFGDPHQPLFPSFAGRVAAAVASTEEGRRAYEAALQRVAADFASTDWPATRLRELVTFLKDNRVELPGLAARQLEQIILQRQEWLKQETPR